MKIAFRRSPRGERGEEVHASSFIRDRRILLDRELLAHAPELVRIVVHEVFHFVWARLDNATRADWAKLIDSEIRRGVPGELGYSAQLRKDRLAGSRRGSKLWKDYLCESFCDTAAWCYSARARHDEVTLRTVAIRAREAWFRGLAAKRKLPL